MNDRTLSLLRTKLNQTYELTPNHFGISVVDRLFSLVTQPLKTFPFKFYVPMAIIAAGIMYLFVGFLVVRLATILQYGF